MKTHDLYGQEYYDILGYGFAAEDRPDHNRILELGKFKKNDRVLEIGSGLGVLLKNIPSKEKAGIETNDYAVKESRKRGLKIIKEDAEKGLPFKDSSFDVIVMNEVIEHFKKPKFVLQECYRILSPRGRLINTTIVKNFFVHDTADTHFSEMTLEEHRKLIKESGFHIITHEVSGISFLQPLLEYICYRPFRLLRYHLIKGRKPEKKVGDSVEKTVGVIDFIHKIADKTVLKPIGTFRNFLLSIGVQQLILAEKK